MPNKLPGPKPKKISYSPVKTVKRLEKSITLRRALEPEIIREEDLKRRAIKMHIRGRDHDYIAQRLQVDTPKVYAWIKEKLQAYIRESYDPSEIKELMAKRYDNIMYQALYMAMPHPKTDEFGRPVVGNTCDCIKEPGILCPIEGHTAQVITRPDPTWAKIYLEVLAEQKKMFGVDAADKMKQTLVDRLERSYKGVPQGVIDNL